MLKINANELENSNLKQSKYVRLDIQSIRCTRGEDCCLLWISVKFWKFNFESLLTHFISDWSILSRFHCLHRPNTFQIFRRLSSKEDISSSTRVSWNMTIFWCNSEVFQTVFVKCQLKWKRPHLKYWIKLQKTLLKELHQQSTMTRI